MQPYDIQVIITAVLNLFKAFKFMQSVLRLVPVSFNLY